MSNLLIAGASKGLGLSLYQGLKANFDHSFLLSRSKPDLQDESANWVQLDLSKPEQISGVIKPQVNKAPIDTLIYNAGIWESDTFNNTPEQEFIDIINVT